MRKLKFDYSMELKFSSPVSSHYFALRCVPGDSLRQKITLVECRVSPADYTSADKDGFGNLKISGGCRRLHDMFRYYVAGTAVVQGMTVQKCPLHPMYRYPSAYAGFQPEVAAFAEEVRREFRRRDAETPVEKAVCTMDYLYSHFAYIPGATTIQTTAAQALRLGKGVCQDYSHIMLSLCRMERIPSRYVVGMLMGEGLSHAWVEICSDGHWIALDPTNNLVVDTQHIKISSGRDYQDCIINQGVFTGFASQVQHIQVSVKEIP